MSREYDYLIYIGRFQPLHLGHQSIIDTALEHAENVIVLVGSANRPRSVDNPWSYEERAQMIYAAYPDKNNAPMVRPLEDADYNDEVWFGLVQSALGDIPNDAKVGLIGFEKDSSSYYLRLFPQWKKFKIKEPWGTVSATQIRENFFQKAPILPRDLCSESVVSYLKQFMLSQEFKYILEEREALDQIKSRWSHAPYTPHFVTADAVVTQAGHILLVTRGEAPGKGLLAMPGGHVVPSVGGSFENCIKELWEETQPRDRKAQEKNLGPMPMNSLRGYYSGKQKNFDKPGRDPRGYYFTTAYRFSIPGGVLWDVSGGDDAADAAWYPIGSLDPRQMFADHYFIIQEML